jgi:hypothetical protein
VFLFSLQLLSETFLILRRIQRDITINIRRSSFKVTVILHRLYRNLNSLDSFFFNIKMSNHTQIRPVGAKLLHADRQRDTTELTVSVHTLSNVSETNICCEA